MGGSEEYLAALGFDTSDVDKAVNQTITLLGHLGNQFDALAGPASRAERNLLKGASASRTAGNATEVLTKAERERVRALETSSKQNAIYNQYLYDQQRAMNGANGNLARLRYAVYDVSNALAIGGAAALAFTGAILGSSIAYERQFADVRRTVGVTGDAADALYGKLIRITTDIPVAFSQITQIATLAGQLGVAEERVASFTETTAQFAATTDVSAEASATAFGRLDQLIDGVDGRYKNLASSILNVGINSVATESQIIAIASQIAATGNQAGLTADEIIGLAGSLASLGVAPEAARGTILRVFSQINSAIAQGGDRLNDFARISGMTASQFRQGWSDDFTGTFLAFLQGVNSNGQDAETAIRALGITAARDVNALLKLSQNTDAVAKNLALASAGFADASILSENFGIIAETNSSRLQVLLQTIQAIAAEVGSATSGPLATFLDYLQRTAETFLQISESPVVSSVLGFGVVLTGAIGIILLLGAAGTRTAGSFLALKTAIGETYLQTMLAKGGMQQYTATLFGAAGASKALGAAVKGTGIGLLVSGGLLLLGEAINAISAAMRSGKDQAEDYFGSLDGLSDALKTDNARVFQQLAEEQSAALADAATTGGSWVAVLEAAAKAQDDLANKTDGGSGAIDAQTLRIGENTREWLRNALASNENFRQIFANIDELNQLTGTSLTFEGTTISGFQPFDVEAYTQALIAGGQEGGQAYIEAFKTSVEQAAIASGADAQTVAAVQDFLSGNEALVAAEEAGKQVTNALTAGMSEAAQNAAIGDVLDNVFGEVEASAEEKSAAFRTLMDDIYGLVNAQAELSANSEKLGQDFAQNGADVAASGSAMQAVIASIYASSSGAPDAAARLQGLFDALVQGGYASAAQLAPLLAIISSLAGGKQVQAVAYDMGSFAKGIQKVGAAAGGGGGAAKAVRTLVDYANDLRSVFSRSFDIRFGGLEARDDIRASWLDISEAIADTNEQIAKYQQKMQELNADKAVREYWLSVAEMYGDTLRAGKLRAEIADIDNELASTSGDLTEAQQKNSKSLKGNSKAAIDNREEILGLVKKYQDYITALAASGASQSTLQSKSAQLKQEFLNQAVALGYSRAELGPYAKAFDDISLAISRVPRNITVKANTNPAMQALNELEAKLKKVSGGNYSPVISPKIKQPAVLRLLVNGSDVRLYRQALEAGKISAREYYQILYGLPTNPYGFKTGTAWTGSGNPNEIAGVVHNREAVLNQKGTQMVPAAWINSWNQGRQPAALNMPKSAGAAASLDGAVVDLAPRTLRQLDEIMSRLRFLVGDQELAAAVDRAHSATRSAGG